MIEWHIIHLVNISERSVIILTALSKNVFSYVSDFRNHKRPKWNALCILFLECRFLVTWQTRSNREHLICYGISDQTIRRGKKKKKECVNIKSWHFEYLQFRVVLWFSFWTALQPLLPENHSIRWDTSKFFSEKSWSTWSKHSLMFTEHL